MRVLAALGLFTASVLAAALLIRWSQTRHRHIRMYIVPSGLPPDLLEEMLARPGPRGLA